MWFTEGDVCTDMFQMSASDITANVYSYIQDDFIDNLMRICNMMISIASGYFDPQNTPRQNESVTSSDNHFCVICNFHRLIAGSTSRHVFWLVGAVGGFEWQLYFKLHGMLQHQSEQCPVREQLRRSASCASAGLLGLPGMCASL